MRADRLTRAGDGPALVGRIRVVPGRYSQDMRAAPQGGGMGKESAVTGLAARQLTELIRAG